MASREMRNWDAGEFGRMFGRAAEAATDEPTKGRLGALSAGLASLEGEACRETAMCGARLASTLDELHSIGRRMGYCEHAGRPGRDCATLEADVERAVTDVEALHRQCFL